MRILLDAMGGDNAPDANIKGAVKAINEISSEIVLVGNEKIINNRIQNCKLMEPLSPHNTVIDAAVNIKIDFNK